MEKKFEIHEWVLLTLAIMICLGFSILILGTIVYVAAQYKYSGYIVIYIAICGAIAFWILKKGEGQLK